MAAARGRTPAPAQGAQRHPDLSPPPRSVQVHHQMESFAVFMCQKCRRPFRVTGEPGLTVKDTEGRLVLTPEVAQTFCWMDPKVMRQQTASGSESFTSPATPSPEDAGDIAAAASVLQHYAADRSGVDHPLCRECAELAIAGLAQKLTAAAADTEVYERQAAQLASWERDAIGADLAQEEAELAALQAEEETLTLHLQKLQEEERQLREEEAQIDAERATLDEREHLFWQEVAAYTVHENQYAEALAGLERKLANAQHDLRILSQTNLLNEAFHMWYDGHYGTINNLRLGRMQSLPVEPNELNAAWGNAALLLNTLARMRALNFKRFRVYPRGTNSTVEKLGSSRTGQAMELWIGAPGFFAGRRHDDAIAGFCACLYELCLDCTMRHPDEGGPPCRIDEDGARVNQLPVRLSANQQTDEKWTRGLKYMLQCLKWALMVTCKYYGDGVRQ
eukprot:TRINITY_DN5897_c0_g1_i1.p1 TRINITY_DN5897_c0_g1~~TRINITY_DN5897_c0_g1_i1.p1  ORF type:complete len:475 (+),score=118.39 TRINITY_DN5897_c0_g1_i1:81-1427(+)